MSPYEDYILGVPFICPCCGLEITVYRWNLYGTAITALALFYRLGGTRKYVQVRELTDLGHKGKGDVSRLKLWGLVCNELTRRPDGGRAGYWRVTLKGEQFLRGEVTLQKYVHVANKAKVVKFEGPQVSIHELMGPFDLREHLGWGA